MFLMANLKIYFANSKFYIIFTFFIKLNYEFFFIWSPQSFRRRPDKLNKERVKIAVFLFLFFLVQELNY